MLALRKYHWLFISPVAVTLLIGMAYARYRYVYPYGRSHCCNKQLYFALLEYADQHGGNFPAGEATPEASLSLIHDRHGHDYANLLCGKTGSEESTKRVLDDGKLLSPETCGWHYLEGLRSDDDPQLALFWDKEGLGHNGERLTGGGHIVMFVDGFTKHIIAEDWEQFRGDQRLLFLSLIHI